ncbi:MAG: ABC transporter permease [Dictyoglomaceae bacterium]
MKEKINFLIKDFGIPRLIILSFLVVLLFLALILGMDVRRLISDSLVRVGRNALLVLALLPPIKAGIGLNFGLPVGIICGLVGLVLGLEYNLIGFYYLIFSFIIGGILAFLAGHLYGTLLNKVKGQEMMVGNYVGFAIVSLMCSFWLLAPFKNPSLIWAIGGSGLRYTLVLPSETSQLLDRFLSFSIMGIKIPTGTFLIFFLLCLLTSFFFKTRIGIAISTIGSNPIFGKASGMNIDKLRRFSIILSTILGSFGIIVYAQSFGFVQLYTAPLMMAFPAIACILIGGATLRKANIMNVVVGTFLFQSLLTITLPVITQVVAISGEAGDITEVLRVIISNGMILYALTRRGGD